jgi:hypothetical protein
MLDILNLEDNRSHQEIDSDGAKIAKGKCRILQSMMAEPFYPVHSKAQKRVAIPNGLNLDIPFNSNAFDDLLSTSLPEKSVISSISFTIASAQTSFSSEFNRSYDEKKSFQSLLTENKSAYTPFGDFIITNSSSNNGQPSSSSSILNARQGSDRMYYLPSSIKVEEKVNPLSQLLADTFDDKKYRRVRGMQSYSSLHYYSTNLSLLLNIKSM